MKKFITLALIISLLIDPFIVLAFQDKPEGIVSNSIPPAFNICRNASLDLKSNDPLLVLRQKYLHNLSALKGIICEEFVDNFITESNSGYFRIISRPGVNQGIDGVYINFKDFRKPIISEAKYGSSRLETTIDGNQMSKEWIRPRAFKMAEFYETASKNIVMKNAVSTFNTDFFKMPLNSGKNINIYYDITSRKWFCDRVTESEFREVVSKLNKISNLFEAISRDVIEYRRRIYNFNINADSTILVKSIDPERGSKIVLYEGPLEKAPRSIHNALKYSLKNQFKNIYLSDGKSLKDAVALADSNLNNIVGEGKLPALFTSPSKTEIFFNRLSNYIIKNPGRSGTAVGITAGAINASHQLINNGFNFKDIDFKSLGVTTAKYGMAAGTSFYIQSLLKSTPILAGGLGAGIFLTTFEFLESYFNNRAINYFEITAGLTSVSAYMAMQYLEFTFFPTIAVSVLTYEALHIGKNYLDKEAAYYNSNSVTNILRNPEYLYFDSATSLAYAYLYYEKEPVAASIMAVKSISSAFTAINANNEFSTTLASNLSSINDISSVYFSGASIYDLCCYLQNPNEIKRGQLTLKTIAATKSMTALASVGVNCYINNTFGTVTWYTAAKWKLFGAPAVYTLQAELAATTTTLNAVAFAAVIIYAGWNYYSYKCNEVTEEKIMAREIDYNLDKMKTK